MVRLFRVTAPGRLRGPLGRPDCACICGRAGIGVKTGEGDGITPVGCFPLRQVLYRADREPPPQTRLARRRIGPADGWCDDPADPAYNRPVRLPRPGRAEALWRTDRLYDLLLVPGYNDAPVVAGLGSAIFLHLAGEAGQPTEGCIAVSRTDMLTILAEAMPDDMILIGPA